MSLSEKEVEHIAFKAGGGNQSAPAQKVTDFVKKNIFRSLFSEYIFFLKFKLNTCFDF